MFIQVPTIVLYYIFSLSTFQDKKHRVLLAERELIAIQRARAAARRAIRLRNQNPPNVAHGENQFTRDSWFAPFRNSIS